MSEATQTVPEDRVPKDLSEVFADLQGFGIEQCEEIITISSGKDVLRIKFSNISTDDDIQANIATEESKGYSHFQGIKAEILSRAISWINGVDLNRLEGKQRLVVDAKTGEKVDFRAAMRSTIKSWGIEVMQVLWKALMVHVQAIEDRLFESLPEGAVMTEVERRYRDRVVRELEEISRDVLTERVGAYFDDAGDPQPEGNPDSGETAK